MDLNSLYNQVIKREDNLLGGVHHLLDQTMVDNMQNGMVVRSATEGVEQQRGVKRSRKERGSSAKERTSKIPPCPPGKRSSIYRGVTRHRWTGRYEAHLWDKSTWNPTQKKKGKQVYLGAYDDEEAAARAYDLAALKYWGPTTLINFPVADYTKDLEEMQHVTREEYLASIRRKSSGFSRGVSKYRGVARHHHNGRWEARIGRVFGNKYLYLGTYSTQEEAAAAYDMAAIEYRGLNAVTNFDLSRYIRWLRPNQMANSDTKQEVKDSPVAATPPPKSVAKEPCNQKIIEQHFLYDPPPQAPQVPVWHAAQPAATESTYQFPSMGFSSQNNINTTSNQKSSSPTALSLLLQSSMFRQMLEKASTRHQLIDMQSNDMGVDQIICNDFLSGPLSDEAQNNDPEDLANYRDSGCAENMMYRDLRSESDPETVFSYSTENAPFVHHTHVQTEEEEDNSVDGGQASFWNAFGTSLNLLPLNAISSC